jgi:ADP-heptose:LPS heptosyltransferase
MPYCSYFYAMRIPQQRKADKYLGYFLIILLLPVTRLLGIFMRRNHHLQPAPHNILFIKIFGLGSLITATDSIKSIRLNYPDARLILLTDKNIAAGIEPFDLFHEIWAVDSTNLSSLLNGGITFLFRSWRLKFCWVVDLEVYSKLTTVYALLTCAINRFGFYLTPVFFRAYLNTHNVPFDQSAYIESNYKKIAEAVTGQPVKETAYAIRENEHLMPYIALNNTCSDLAPVRKLPGQTFAKVCCWLLQNTNYKIAITGAPEDQKSIQYFIEGEPVLAMHKGRVLNLAGSKDFISYYQFLSQQCALLVSIDSGPLHIAKKLGLPTVSVWGPTDPYNHLNTGGQDQRRHLVYYQRVSCSPCVHFFEKLPCNGDNFCMKNLDPDLIIKNIQLVLSEITPVA